MDLLRGLMQMVVFITFLGEFKMVRSLFFLTFFAAWLTHVVVCLDESKWGFLIAGALMFPIAIVHGAGIWFGLWH
jgi:hypothetical protein